MDKQIFEELQEWGARVSRLVQLMALTNKTLQLHRELDDTPSQIKQYERLLAEHQHELDTLLQTHGLTLKILPPDHAA
ncbi:hypothetical protein [Dyadobacter sandarakinus]|uniref:Uncharacterized protein n=1 Tax=Dyadobacter sandarakinus TaxID=2747268 RepID=A0ABX7I5N0_9BACT|nr:hypothetical protein [Dyadobacter sandarakinus]QRR01185.1 hypothetical protein HWI92_09845 [Dyadobacter sandarakinus]